MWDQLLNKWDFYRSVWLPGSGLPNQSETIQFFERNPGEWGRVEGWQDGGSGSSNDLFARSYNNYTTVFDQKAEIRRLAAEAEATATKQREEAAALQAQQALRISTIQSVGQAVTQSLRILAGQGQQQAPTAAVAPGKKKAAGAATTTASLRMGATSRGAGAGANLSI